MTDNTNDSGSTPEPVDDAAPIAVNESGEASTPAFPANQPAPMHAPPAPPSDEQQADSQQADSQTADSQPVTTAPADTNPVTTHRATTSSAVTHSATGNSPDTNAADAEATVPVGNAPTTPEVFAADRAQAQVQAGHDQTAAYPTDAYPRDAFGRPLDGAVGPHGAAGQPNIAPNVVPRAYATADAYPGQPFAGAKPRTPGRRTGSVTLIAALAIGALIGGSSGAGITALMMNGQNNGVPVSQAAGPSNVVVNNTKSVNEITAVAAKASPSVVTIDVASSSSGGTGSGVILSEDGYVLTNTHVVTLDGAASDVKIEVKSNDGKLYTATLVGTDPISDLAVIKLTDASGLTPMVWGDSSELNVGDSAIAIGAPLGLSGTVTDGIVSALNRSITVASSAAPTSPDTTTPDEGQGQNPFFFDFPNQDGTQSQGSQSATSSIALPVIQTDAAINPGNSGGALLNASGELIGINVAIASAGSTTSSSVAGSIGVGFSIPSNFAKRISDEIIANGTATHGLLGASVKDASSSTSSTVGALISDVTTGGAAEKAGLAADDVITNFNGVPITDAIDLTAQVRVLPAGGTADVTYVRDGKSITVSVTVGELSS
ncbi:trypsin-like peptidase domain-containing protein [Cryobacterium sp. PH29-G1]|uniref:trypsin-like peptidase domain-containing protein n=1 Tax=Cryobacterium sp. PH29-G1 TaxID=3046211 RepID=UPI0024BB59D5|nr:trypsin-like peptidase domain-containing protein [Cryobacterium sp. PH29-G1]MDJ0349020.1 trypsin-like peptidase domain-containing protein [Cryobacterium sp. PH29-G1]